MISNDTKRLSRLTAILTQLQVKQLVTASELAVKFTVSIRTIYRDIRALEEAGIPVVTEEGKGYTLMEGYRIPPVMFTEQQANALILAQQLVLASCGDSEQQRRTQARTRVIRSTRGAIRHTSGSGRWPACCSALAPRCPAATAPRSTG